jgi:phage protein D
MSEQVVGLWIDVWLDNTDISAQVKPYVLSLEYSDNLDGDSPDNITLTLEDTAGLFQNQYYPKKGASLRFEFGFDKPGGEMVFKSAVGFEIDEVSIEGAPDKVKWKASGQMPAGKIHTPRSRAWKSKTLKEIAKAIAGEHGLGFVYESEDTIKFNHVSQFHESNWRFLKRLSSLYGIQMSLKAGNDKLTLVMIATGKPMKKGMLYEIKRDSVTSFSFTDKSSRGTGGTSTAYFDADNKKKVTAQADGEGEGHEIRTVGISQFADAHIQGSKDDAKKDELTGSLTLPGNPRLVSGVLLNLTGWGRNDGEWLIKKSKHKLDVASGYTTEIELRRLS